MIAPQQLGTFEPLQRKHLTNTTNTKRRAVLYDFSNQVIPFEVAWKWQQQCLESHLDRLSQQHPESSSFFVMPNAEKQRSNRMENGVDTIFMLQHAPVYTLGTASDEAFILQHNKDNKVPTVRMDRGGEVTYHGPGQLTVYPILDLRSYRQDIHWYMRALEEAVLIALTRYCQLPAERQGDTTGVWIHNSKVAAIGIKCRKWITMHGLAVNVEATALDNFQGIVPCGLRERQVGCVNQFLDTPLTVPQFAEYMKQALKEVFQLEELVVSSSIQNDFLMETENYNH